MTHYDGPLKDPGPVRYQVCFFSHEIGIGEMRYIKMGRKVKKREEKQSKKVEHNKRGKKDKKKDSNNEEVAHIYKTGGRLRSKMVERWSTIKRGKKVKKKTLK